MPNTTHTHIYIYGCVYFVAEHGLYQVRGAPESGLQPVPATRQRPGDPLRTTTGPNKGRPGRRRTQQKKLVATKSLTFYKAERSPWKLSGLDL